MVRVTADTRHSRGPISGGDHAYRGTMRPVVSLTSRHTLAAIRASLKETGQARCDLMELRVEADEWRALARKAARELGRTVQTIEADGQVVAILRDWPKNDEERAITIAEMRRAIKTMQGPKPPHN